MPSVVLYFVLKYSAARIKTLVLFCGVESSKFRSLRSSLMLGILLGISSSPEEDIEKRIK